MKCPWHLACLTGSSVVLCAGLLLVACGKDEVPSAMAGAGAAPAAGTVAAGMTGGVAGMTGGTGAAGSGAGGIPTCATAKKGTPAELHAAALAAMAPTTTPMSKNCAFSSCHDANVKRANLTIIETMDLKAQLIGKAACEAPTLQLVDTSGGDAALAKSWLWQKLTAPVNASGVLTPKPEWGTASETCGQQPGQGFGLRMPMGTGTQLYTESKLLAIRDWICAGAAGP